MDANTYLAMHDLSHLRTSDADVIIELAEAAIMEALKAYDHDDAQAEKDAEDCAELVFVGLAGLCRTGVVREGLETFESDFGDSSIFMNDEVLSHVLNAAKSTNLSMSEWIFEAIQEKMTKQTFGELEASGFIKRNGKVRNGYPVFVEAALNKKMN